MVDFHRKMPVMLNCIFFVRYDACIAWSEFFITQRFLLSYLSSKK